MKITQDRIPLFNVSKKQQCAKKYTSPFNHKFWQKYDMLHNAETTTADSSKASLLVSKHKGRAQSSLFFDTPRDVNNSTSHMSQSHRNLNVLKLREKSDHNDPEALRKIESLTKPVAPNLSTSARSRADARYTKNDFMREFFKIKMANYLSPKTAKAPKLATASRSFRRINCVPSDPLLHDREANHSKHRGGNNNNPYQTDTRLLTEDSQDSMRQVALFNEQFRCRPKILFTTNDNDDQEGGYSHQNNPLAQFRRMPKNRK